MEVGVREHTKYTFRHFSTTWALQGLLLNNLISYKDESVFNGLNYLTSLQDKNFGGWKSSEDADNYTWATCNALNTIILINKSLSKIKDRYFLELAYDWWQLKKRDANFCHSLFGIDFAFNKQMGISFCVTFTLLILFVIYFSQKHLNSLNLDNNIINGGLVVFFSVILGIPWIILIYNIFRVQFSGNWINAISWVYGILTGFVFFFYQYFKP